MKKYFLFAIIPFISTLSCHAMLTESEDASPVLKRVMGVKVCDLQEKEATVSYKLPLKTLGNCLGLNSGDLEVTCPPEEEYRDVVSSLYQRLKDGIHSGYETENELNISAKSQSHEGAFCIGKKSLTLLSEEVFTGNNAIFGSQGAIHFSSRVLTFGGSFIEVNPDQTTIVFAPPATLNSPIKSITYTPKRSPVFVQGGIDFTTLSFDDFLVSDSEVVISFRKQE